MLEALFGRVSVETEPVELHLASAGWTAQGRSRDINQDQWVANPVGRVFIVADGIGGGACGDIASRTAAECLRHELIPSRDEYEDPTDMIHAAFAAAREKILQTAASRDCDCMGTTASCAVIRDDQLTVGWVGDSRVYLIRDGRARLLTHDQTLAQGLADAGVIPEDTVGGHRMRNVLWNYLGTGEDVTGRPEVLNIRIEPGDHILLMTDGVSDLLDESQLASISTHSMSPKVATSRIVQTALAQGATDDATCVAVFVETDV